MSSPKTLIVDGTDLRSLAGVTLTDLNLVCLYAPGARRGSHTVIPRKRGQRGAQLELDAYNFTVMTAVTGVDESDLEQNLAGMYSAVSGTKGLVALGRRVAKVGGGYNTHTAAGAFSGFANFSSPGPLDVEVDLQFVNLDGGWWDGSTWLVP